MLPIILGGMAVLGAGYVAKKFMKKINMKLMQKSKMA